MSNDLTIEMTLQNLFTLGFLLAAAIPTVCYGEYCKYVDRKNQPK